MSARYRTDFVPELEATRGIAALMVAGAHAVAAPVILEPGGARLILIRLGVVVDSGFEALVSVVLRALLNPTGAVLFFFVLSGFVLTASLERSGTLGRGAAGRFFVSRLFRIYPAVIATVLLFVALYLTTGRTIDLPSYSARTVLENMLLLNHNIDGVMWSMQTELLATPVILAAFALAYWVGRPFVVALALLLLAFAYQDWWLQLTPFTGASPRTKYIYAFVFGAAAFWYGPAVVARLNPRHVTAWTALAVGFFLFWGLELHPKYWFITNHLKHVGEVGSSTAFIALIAYGRPRFFSRALVGSSFVRMLGRASYSFYLLHPITLTVIWKMPESLGAALNAGIPVSVLSLALFIASTAVALPLALLSYRYVEVPGIQLGRRLIGSRRAPSPDKGWSERPTAPAIIEPPLDGGRERSRAMSLGVRFAGGVALVAVFTAGAVNYWGAQRGSAGPAMSPAKSVPPLAVVKTEGVDVAERSRSPFAPAQSILDLTSQPASDFRRVFLRSGTSDHPAVAWIREALFWEPPRVRPVSIFRAVAWVKPGSETSVLLDLGDASRSTVAAVEFDLAERRISRRVVPVRDAGIEAQADGWIRIWTELESDTPDLVVQVHLYGYRAPATLTLGGAAIEGRGRPVAVQPLRGAAG